MPIEMLCHFRSLQKTGCCNALLVVLVLALVLVLVLVEHLVGGETCLGTGDAVEGAAQVICGCEMAGRQKASGVG